MLSAPPEAHPTGPVIQAAVLSAIREVAPDLAQRLHDGGSPPLYHTALVREGRANERVLHVGLAREDDHCELLSAWMRRPPPSLRLADAQFSLVRIEADEGPRTWEELATDGPARVRLYFRTPTLFRAPRLGPGGPRPVRVFPSPERVLDTLGRRWAAFSTAPVEVSDLAAWVNETDVRGRVVDWGGAHPIRGFVGSVAWSLTGRRREIWSLLRLGQFLGVGARTTQGCGHLELDAQ